MKTNQSQETETADEKVEAYILLFAEHPCRLLAVHPPDEQMRIPSFLYDDTHPYTPNLCVAELAVCLGLPADPPSFRPVAELMPIANDKDFLCAMHNPKGLLRLLHVAPASDINLQSAVEACGDPQIRLTSVPEIRDAMFEPLSRRGFRAVRQAAWTCFIPCGNSAFAPSGRCAHTVIEDMASMLNQSLRRIGLVPFACMERQSRYESKSLFKVPTQNGLYYTKECYRGSNEVSLTTCITHLFPADTLELLTSDKILNCFVAKGFSSLMSVTHLYPHCLILKKLARMQNESVAHLQALKQAGLPEMTPRVLATKIVNLASDHRINSELQVLLQPAVNSVQSLCAELERTNIPNTLVQGDFALRNMGIRDELKRDNGLIFFDWETACHAHPFCDLCTQYNDWDTAAVDEYLALWLPKLGRKQARRYGFIAKILGEVITACHYLGMASAAISCDQRLLERTAECHLQSMLRDLEIFEEKYGDIHSEEVAYN